MSDSSTDSAAYESDAATKGFVTTVGGNTSCRSFENVLATVAEKLSAPSGISFSSRVAAPDVIDGVVSSDSLNDGMTVTQKVGVIRHFEVESSMVTTQHSNADSTTRQKTSEPLLTSTPKTDQRHSGSSDDSSHNVNKTNALTTGETTLVYVIPL